MKKNKNNVVFFVFLSFIMVFIVAKDKITLRNNEYIVSNDEINDKKSILVEGEKLTSAKDESNRYEKDDISKNIEDDNNDDMITIYISGQVKKIGLITVDKDTRLGEAIEVAGGVEEDADLNRVNMALKVKDEYHYIIPKIGEDISAESLVSGNGEENNPYDNEVNKTKININKASLKELDDLPGVGEATANKIIKYREENGKFNSVEEIKNVNGIGDKKFEDIKDLITIN